MTIGEAQRFGEQTLAEAGISSRRLDASLLLEKVTGHPRSHLLARPEEALDATTERHYLKLISQRRRRTPLVHLTNRKDFNGLELYIDERVLTPRVETEKMAELAIKLAPPSSRLIDVGTGSGALALAIKKHRPDLEVWASDVSDSALKVAQLNARKTGLEVKFVASDLLENIPGRFGTVVTNLPYLRDDAELMPEVKLEPEIALLGGSDGLDLYRRFLNQVPNHLESGGLLFTECDPWQQPDLIDEATKFGLEPIEQTYFILSFRLKPNR